jgi:hypothetical protein
VNETDVKDLFAAAVAHPAADRIDTDAVLRNGRRRRRVRTAATVGSVAGVVALLGSLAFVARPHQTVDPVNTAAPAKVAVSCSPKGLTVSGDTVAATSAGVVVSVSSTLPKGSYLSYQWSSGGGGEPLPATTATWTLLAPPGILTLACQLPNGSPGTPQTVTVTDPQNVWSSQTLADLGCGAGGSLSWAGPPGSGSTPAAAVQGLLPTLSIDRPGVTVARAAIGYRDATTQTWIASADGTPYMSIVASPVGSSFMAAPDTLCAS